MALQLSTTARNARLDAIETDTGVSAVLKIYDLTAGAPADCAAAITATTLVTMNLESDWMAAAGSGSKAKAGTWSGSASGDGTADFFRLFKSDGTTCQIQGTVGLTSSGEDMELDNTSIASGQTVTVTTFTLTDANS